jgi:hypothetical protein
MSWMFTRPEGMDWFVNLRPTMLDDPARFEPLIETWVAEKLPWAVTGAPHGFGGERSLPAARFLGDNRRQAEFRGNHHSGRDV